MSESEDPKIIVDEDWKSQVQAEKEKAADAPPEPESAPEMPPPSLELLVTSLATQAAVALGLVEDPFTNSVNVDLEIAKHHIDTLGIIEEKTKGNLTKAEEAMIGDALHQLRMLFVQISNNPPNTEGQAEGGGGGIVTP